MNYVNHDAPDYFLVTFASSTMFGGQVFPKRGETAFAIPILNECKSPPKPNSHQPISLTLCVGKLFERMIRGLPFWLLEYREILPEVMGGFRRWRCTADGIGDLSSPLEEARRTAGLHRLLSSRFIRFLMPFLIIWCCDVYHTLEFVVEALHTIKPSKATKHCR